MLHILNPPLNRCHKNWISQTLPAQHGVGLSCEDGGIHHKSCVVHNQRYSFSQPQSTAVPLFTAEVIHVDHIAQSLAQCFGVVVCSRSTQGPRYVSPNQGPSNVGIGERNPGRTWTGGSGGRASVTTFTVCGREKDTWTPVKQAVSQTHAYMLLRDGHKTMGGQLNSDFWAV